jgi:hypothetical protein
MKGLRSSEGPQIPSAEPTPAFAGSDQQVLYDGFVVKNQGRPSYRRAAPAPACRIGPFRRQSYLLRLYL